MICDVEGKLSAIERYLSVYIKASERTRGVYFLMVGFASLTIITFISTSDSSWNAERLESISYAIEYLKSMDPEDSSPSQSTGDGSPPLTTSLEPASTPPTEEVDPEKEERLRRGQEYLNYARVTDKKVLEDKRTFLEKQKAEANTLNLPIVGIKFDINDLGVVSGFFLFFLTLILKFNTFRELQNLKLVKAKSREIQAEDDAYEYLASNEVLNQPRPLDLGEESPSINFSINVPKLLVFLPFLSHAVVVYYDVQSIKIGLMLSESRTIFTLAVEWFMLSTIVFLSIFCFIDRARFAREWEAWRIEAVKARQTKDQAQS